MERFRIFLTVLLFTSLSFAIEGEGQGLVQKSDTAAVVKKDSVKTAYKPNAALACAASLVFPGGGQIYTGHYVKAGLFFLSELGVGLYGYQQYVNVRALKHDADSLGAIAYKIKIDSMTFKPVVADTAKKDTTWDTTRVGWKTKLTADSAWFEEKEARNLIYQSLAWMAGIYYYNVLDALQCAGVLKSSSKKNPTLAGWLSAIPGLGLGQIYNGELSKAGLILMTQFNLGYLALNYHLIMAECERYEASFDPNDKAVYSLYSGAQRDRWEFRRTQAFKNRNMYLWYSLVFYFYGIFDAVVDAHLHDAPVKLRLEPDLVPETKEIGLKATMPF